MTTAVVELIDAGDLVLGARVVVGECWGTVTEKPIRAGVRLVVTAFLCVDCGRRHPLVRFTTARVGTWLGEL